MVAGRGSSPSLKSQPAGSSISVTTSARARRSYARSSTLTRNRGHIDLSLKDVNEHQRREKIREWKNESKARKWIGFVAEKSGEPAVDIENAILDKYGELYAVFEDIVTDSDATVKKLGLSKKAGEALVHIAHESVKIPKVEVTGQLVLMSAESDGVTVIRNALKKASESKTAGADIELLYLGAPVTGSR